MACKHLIKRQKQMPLETGGPTTPQFYTEEDCRLDRIDDYDERIIGATRKCSEVNADGPCWIWVKYKPENADPAFDS